MLVAATVTCTLPMACTLPASTSYHRLSMGFVMSMAMGVCAVAALHASRPCRPLPRRGHRRRRGRGCSPAGSPGSSMKWFDSARPLMRRTGCSWNLACSTSNNVHLGVDPKLPIGHRPMSASMEENISTNPSLFQNDYGDDVPMESFVQRGYGACCHSPLPNSLMFNVDKKPYLSQLQQHCPVDADLVDPYFENFPYGATKLVAGGTLGRNSHYKGNFGGGFASPINCPYPFSDVYFSSEKIRVDSKWDASKLHDSFQVLNRPMKSPPVNVGPQLVRLPGNMESFGSDDSLVIQGKGLHYVRNQWTDNLKETKRSQFDGQLHAQRMLLTLPLKYDNLTGVKGCTYYIAKDQHGCRSLQRKLDEGKHQIDMIFNGVIDHAVELMVDPFGNYLMQKLLEVCSEEQLLQILLLLKEDPADLVNISLNIHGTRAVQKLIGSLKTRQQIALVISAIKPGFLDLIKDLNGSHVLQRCLESFKVEDNKFIFDAAAKHCVDIATHRHGCCVLQKCIAYSIGEDQAELVSEISANGYELAQDPFGALSTQRYKRPAFLMRQPSEPTHTASESFLDFE
ncbi:Pumilio domain-containing protein C6G9.14 [Musa troglodytarum]|uniref:Pumilio domain-containing protein C6G9.14 n=1 Tax=Musa troglodytarum TaxID=320322 RepID=A0A9E7KV01_9LILI|nr:Pumilio domain-containing protein C6G9.14 [Musa troglodytarum]